ncbi:MAG: hypothetical protein CO189_02220 [candidate division Zixibacteria bacterium CG_4_9_14_3_um_filter_46_8]|nr:MAG: hypothetical protein CO189_02220 [candidate division Zixibacteria bacterium CG_4_9_14_3_um_filter_46_8]
MLRKLLPILILAAVVVMFSSDLYAGVTKVKIKDAQAKERIPDEQQPSYNSGPGVPYQPSLTLDSPGIIIGGTYYDYQTNGSSGHRIAKHDCGVHIAWMNGIEDYSGQRDIYYNYIDQSGTPGWGDTGTPASTGTRAGYCQITEKTETGEAIIVWHENGIQCKVAVDAGCGLGLFTVTDVPSTLPAESALIWPYVTYDYNGNIQVINTETTTGAQATGHTFSTDMGANFSSLASYTDSVMDLAGVVVSSPIDGKCAIVYTQPRGDEPTANQYNNDVVYIETTDDTNWGHYSKTNVTNYVWEDTLRAYTDVAATYDYEGNLHILWNAPYYNADSGFITVDACLLFHWSEATGITLVRDAWHASFPGAWNRSASKMSISANPYGATLYALWTEFDDIDVSAGGWSNGELYLSYSTDGGATWSEAQNVTNSPSEGCQPGDCFSDHWSSMAKEVDNQFLYISYIEDKDAGGIVQTEGMMTQNPVRYYAFPNPSPISSVNEDGTVPSTFNLNQNYPNPFNASTVVSFTLERSANVNLTIYNLLGEKVAVLADGRFNAGEHSVNWNAANQTSGVYYYRFSADGISETRHMILMK